jgi:hypothetical protein
MMIPTPPKWLLDEKAPSKSTFSHPSEGGFHCTTHVLIGEAFDLISWNWQRSKMSYFDFTNS